MYIELSPDCKLQCLSEGSPELLTIGQVNAEERSCVGRMSELAMRQPQQGCFLKEAEVSCDGKNPDGSCGLQIVHPDVIEKSV